MNATKKNRKPVTTPSEVTLDSNTLARALDAKSLKRLMVAAVEDGTFIQDALDICEECKIPARVALA